MNVTMETTTKQYTFKHTQYIEYGKAPNRFQPH